ncbi:MAG: LTA synthase family protein [Planctomycetes bacterium]|nr:LTA synthase family protein [Planctomycetota bacterium]
MPSKFSGRLKPFRNVIIVIMESVRWKGLGPDASAINARAPTIGKLATEGTLARCYVSIPHSSKAEFAILTGRNALAGIEIRESMKDRFPSVMWSLQERRSARTFCFSVQNLLFENTIGMLRACGIQTCIGPQELLSRSNTRSDPTSSFGESDELLLNGPRRLLADCNDPFAAVYMTLSAHYPYEYPSKYPKDDHSIESYWKSIAYLDSILGKLFAELKGGGLLEDTLLVLVGDHGESFGEHGTYIHNNSMYEEEISVPLVFWSADGRLKNSEVQTARQIDIAPSIADLMSIDDKDYLVQGRSIFRKCPEEPIYVSSFFEGVSMAVIAGRHKTIWFPDNNRVLKYDLFLDPHEQESMDLSESEHRATIQRLRAFDAYQRRIFD